MWNLFFLSFFHIASSKLVSVTGICRHGDRWPQIEIPNYPGKGNPEQLTEEGMHQHKQVGMFLRDHYADFLSESYSEDENYIRVSNYDRCFLSAQSQFYGIYSDFREKNKSLSFPMYSETRNYEVMLRGFDVCHKSRDRYTAYTQTDEFKNYIKTLQPTFDKLSKEIDYEVDSSNYERVLDAMVIKEIYDELTDVEKECKPILEEAATTLRPHFFDATSDDWIRGSTGLLLEELFHVNPENDLNPTGKQKKYRLYSAHDSTVFAFLHTLQHPSKVLPYYAAIVIIELRTDEENDNKPYFQFFYQTDQQEAYQGHLWEPFIPPTCPSDGTPCYLDAFVAKWKPYMANVSEASPFDLRYVDPTSEHNKEYNVNTNPLTSFIAQHCQLINPNIRPAEAKVTVTEDGGISQHSKNVIVIVSVILFTVGHVMAIIAIILFAIHCCTGTRSQTTYVKVDEKI